MIITTQSLGNIFSSKSHLAKEQNWLQSKITHQFLSLLFFQFGNISKVVSIAHILLHLNNEFLFLGKVISLFFVKFSGKKRLCNMCNIGSSVQFSIVSI